MFHIFLFPNFQYTKLERAIVEIDWFLLSPNDQKFIAMVLHRIQNCPMFTIGPFAVLNYETATNVRKNFFH